MKGQKDILELLEAGVIDEATAKRIQDYYETKKAGQPNRLLLVFGILGALLVGLGIILILAHNWDDFSRGTKTVFAFIPLIIGQALCAWVIWKERSAVWREGSSTFLFFTIGACMALVSQIYNIPGSLPDFLLTWALLVLPLVYLVPSSTVSVLYIGGIAWYTAAKNIDLAANQSITYWYWPLLGAILPYYYQLLQKAPKGNFIRLHHFALTISLAIGLMPHFVNGGSLIVPAYIFLGGIYYLIGQEFDRPVNTFTAMGSIFILGILIALTFEGFWDSWYDDIQEGTATFHTTTIGMTSILFLIGLGLFVRRVQREGWGTLPPLSPVLVAFPILLGIAAIMPDVAQFLVNVFILIFGVRIIQKGIHLNHLGIVNYGVALIAILIICRFFDTDIPFVFRGLLFIAVGAGFFGANYYMNKKRQSHV